MKFADFHAGQGIEAGPYVVTEAEVPRFARARDPQGFHTDPTAAAEEPFGGLIATSAGKRCWTRRRRACSG